MITGLDFVVIGICDLGMFHLSNFISFVFNF